MNAIFQGNHPIYIGAHRGASAICPENTMSSFKKAVELKADMLELDVQLTKDEEVVVYHDFYLEDEAYGKRLLRDYTLYELNNIDIGSRFSAEFVGEGIPLLEEVLAWAKDKIWLSIELKHLEYTNEPLAKKVVQLIESYQMERQVQIMSFNHQLLAQVRSYNKKVMTNVIVGSRLVNPIKYLTSLNAQVLNVPVYHLSPSLIDELHKDGFYVHGSMSDDVDVFKQLMEWNVDAMDTNLPDLMIRQRQNIKKKLIE